MVVCMATRYYNSDKEFGSGGMVDLLLLGIIPGTNIQISFSDWLTGTALVVMAWGVYVLHKKRIAALVIILMAFYWTTRRARLALPLA